MHVCVLFKKKKKKKEKNEYIKSIMCLCARADVISIQACRKRKRKIYTHKLAAHTHKRLKQNG